MPETLAHRRSRRFRIDPCFSATRLLPAPDQATGAPWLYAPGDFETWRLIQVRAAGFRDCTDPFHPGRFAAPATAVWFRHAWPKALGTKRLVLRFHAVGSVAIKLAGRSVYHQQARDGEHRWVIPAGLARGELRLTIATTGEPPTLRWAGGVLADSAEWEVAADGFRFAPVARFPATRTGQPPHRSGEPEVELAPVSCAEGIADFGRELLARVLVPAGHRPGLLTVGESPTEVRTVDRTVHEQHLALVPQTAAARGGAKEAQQSAAQLALRWAQVAGVPPQQLRARASFHPVRYRGAFACSDDQLTAIWMRSAYTLRLCMQEFLVDGLKRDRMPWVGDLALSVLANGYTFADDTIVTRTLTALYGEGVGRSHLNGIVDYSLWWPIALAQQQRLSGALARTAEHQERLRRLLADLLARCTPDGLLPAKPGDWVFIDWVALRKDGVVTAVQVLWRWALLSIASLLADPVAQKTARAQAARVTTALRRAWTAQGYRMLVDRDSPLCRHATLLAVMADGLPAGGRVAARNLLAGDHRPAVGTPYMGAFQAAALAKLGDSATALAQIRATWGGMLDQDATTFWEAYDPAHSGDQHWAFYGRTFGKSLCHAWGSGPAALLPQILLGVRPLSDGWTRIALAPRLLDLAWVCATIPTPLGDLEVEARAGTAPVVRLPPGASIVYRGRTWQGGGRRHLH